MQREYCRLIYVTAIKMMTIPKRITDANTDILLRPQALCLAGLSPADALLLLPPTQHDYSGCWPDSLAWRQNIRRDCAAAALHVLQAAPYILIAGSNVGGRYCDEARRKLEHHADSRRR
jgi:hypothetical protein